MEGKYSHYAVRVGRVPGIYTSWEEAEPQVTGFPFAKFKGFKSLGEALKYMQHGKEKKEKGPLRNVDSLTPQMRNMGVGSSQGGSSWHDGSSQGGSSPGGSPATRFGRSIPSIPIGSVDVDFVPETQLGGFLIAEDMVQYLVRACTKLNMPWPIVEGREFYSAYGVRMFCFTAALRCNERGLNLKVEGCISAEQSRARDNAAYKLLDVLLRHTGNSILDFNYRRLCAAQQQVQELQEAHDREVPERVRELEEKCEALTKEIEKYHKVSGVAVNPHVIVNDVFVRGNHAKERFSECKGKVTEAMRSRDRRANTKATASLWSHFFFYGHEGAADDCRRRGEHSGGGDSPYLARPKTGSNGDPSNGFASSHFDHEIAARDESLTSALKAHAALLYEHGKAVEVLAAKVSDLEAEIRSPPLTQIPQEGQTLRDLCNIHQSGDGFVLVEEGDGFVFGDLSGILEEQHGAGNQRSCKRRLEFVNFTSEDMDILYSIKQRYIGCPFAFLSHNKPKMLAEETPACLDLIFRPSAGIRFVGTELAVAAYIFSNHRDDKKILYTDSHCDGSRKRLWSLIPGRELFDDVLNMVVGMCTRDKADKTKWWLPTTFSQMIVNPEQYTRPTMEYIIERYMGIANRLHEIYVPMHCRNHWYLVIVDVWNNRLVYLDSFKSQDPKEVMLRVGQMKEVARYLEGMLQEARFWENPDPHRRPVYNYEVFYPYTGQQAPGSMDCRVWVCQWMINSHLWLDFRLEEVNDFTRMTLAVDLVTNPTNPIAETISDRALNYRDAAMLRDYKSQSATKKKGKSPQTSSSPTI
ncbi:hypothetical protein PIB30_007347 [Stylosanthes scabra]|uniref:Ubiquitin-like protease family profile domain-containing protein n=1 Tax=Stylosanthes scabra TaxID=79078 RepID=A0ABU6Y1P8_9FABA|nr:hypothetical protein [Stylosanthes scabra]